MLKLTRCRKCMEVISDPTRTKMVEALAKKSPQTVTQIVDHFRLTQPTISHHLHILRSAKFVTSEKKGNEILYSLNKKCHGNCNENCYLLSLS